MGCLQRTRERFRVNMFFNTSPFKAISTNLLGLHFVLNGTMAKVSQVICSWLLHFHRAIIYPAENGYGSPRSGLMPITRRILRNAKKTTIICSMTMPLCPLTTEPTPDLPDAISMDSTSMIHGLFLRTKKHLRWCI